MVNKDVKELFDKHMIAATIKADLDRVKNSNEMQAFTRGLSFKSAKTKQVDLELVNQLLQKLDQYSKGWIMANANSTGELWNKGVALDQQEKRVTDLCHELNGLVNKVIINIKDRIPEKDLNSLRNLEKAYRAK